MHTYRHTHRHRYRHNHTSTYSSPDILVLEHAWVEVVNLSCDIQDVTNTNETQHVWFIMMKELQYSDSYHKQLHWLLMCTIRYKQ